MPFVAVMFLCLWGRCGFLTVIGVALRRLCVVKVSLFIVDSVSGVGHCCTCLFERSRGFPYRDCRLSLTFRCSVGDRSLCVRCFRGSILMFIFRGAVRVFCGVSFLSVSCSCALTLRRWPFICF